MTLTTVDFQVLPRWRRPLSSMYLCGVHRPCLEELFILILNVPFLLKTSDH